MMQTVNVSVDLLNGILAYMGTRPFSEVYQLVNRIQAEAQPQLEPATPAEGPEAE